MRSKLEHFHLLYHLCPCRASPQKTTTLCTSLQQCGPFFAQPAHPYHPPPFLENFNAFNTRAGTQAFPTWYALCLVPENHPSKETSCTSRPCH
jgi:hypothetical protein